MKKMCDYAKAFAIWELRLYLDTHPCDTCALKKYSELCGGCGCEGNERSYGCLPREMYDCDRWRWIDDPWPWEYEANCHCQRRQSNCCAPTVNCCGGIQTVRRV